MVINEIFYSLQGEGRLTGVPSVFVRIAGCALRCRWCDTKYAWSPTAGKDYSAGQVKHIIENYPARHLVITGGEPFFAEGLTDFISEIAGDMHVTIETAAPVFLPSLRCDLMSISPKLSNSIPPESALARQHEQHRCNPGAIRKLVESYNYQLKFVIDDPEDLEQVHLCLRELGNIDPANVFLMPQAATSQEFIGKYLLLAEYCKQTGFTLSQRLQVLLWDNRPGM